MTEPNNPLLNEIRGFSHRNLRPVKTKVTTGSGQHVTESRNAKGIQSNPTGTSGPGFVVDTKPDLQVGLIVPGLMIGKFVIIQQVFASFLIFKTKQHLKMLLKIVSCYKRIT